MPNQPVPAAEGMPKSQLSLVIDARDVLSRASDLCRLTSMAVDSLIRDDEVNAIGSGVYEVEKCIASIRDLLDSALEVKR